MRSYVDYFEALAVRESSGNYRLESSLGFLGRYQFSELSLAEIGYYRPDGTAQMDYAGSWTGRDGIRSKADFLANAGVQDAAVREYTQWNWTTLTQYGFDVYAGQTLNGQRLTLSGILGAAWLVGFEGMRDYLVSGGTHAANDPYGTSMMEYVALFNDYDTPFRTTLAGDNVIRGGDGTDVLAGRGGDDTLDGGAGWDGARFRGERDAFDIEVDGTAATVRHRGGEGTDRLFAIEYAIFDDATVDLTGGSPAGGGTGHDRDDPGRDPPVRPSAVASRGDDRLVGTKRDDDLAGGHGDDVLRGGAGDDRLHGGRGDDRLEGGSGHDRLIGALDADRLFAGGGRDRLDGGKGRDVLDGGDGADRISGGPQPDRIIGGPGNDRLEGGGGGDRFVFRPGDGHDRISGYRPDVDRLDLRAFDLDDFEALTIVRERGDGDAIVILRGATITLEDILPRAIEATDVLI